MDFQTAPLGAGENSCRLAVLHNRNDMAGAFNDVHHLDHMDATCLAMDRLQGVFRRKLLPDVRDDPMRGQ